MSRSKISKLIISSLLSFIFTSTILAGGNLASINFATCTPTQLKNHLARLKSSSSESKRKDKLDLNKEALGDRMLFLSAAQKTPYPEIIKMLVKEKASVNVKDDDGMNAVMLAARYNPEPAVMKEIIKAKVSVSEKNNDGMTAIMLAAKYSPKAEIIEELIEAGADPKEKNSEGMDSFEIAKSAKNWVAYEELTKNNLLKLDFMTCSVADIRSRVKGGADVNEKNKYGVTALMLAARDNRNPAVVKALLKLGADIFAKDINGKNALDYSRVKNNTKAEKELIKAGVPELNKPEEKKPAAEEEKEEDTKKDAEKPKEEKKEEPEPPQEPEKPAASDTPTEQPVNNDLGNGADQEEKPKENII